MHMRLLAVELPHTATAKKLVRLETGEYQSKQGNLVNRGMLEMKLPLAIRESFATGIAWP